MKSLPENKTHSPNDQARFLGKKEPNSSHRTRQAEHWHVALSLLTTRLQTTESSFHTSNGGAVPKLCASGAIGIKPSHHVVSGAAQEEPALTKRTYAARVRFGSLAAAPSDNGRGRFTPESGHERSRTPRPLWANNGLMHCNMIGEHKKKDAWRRSFRNPIRHFD
jgi:hypothetical protein